MRQNPMDPKIIRSQEFNGAVLKAIVTNTCPSYKEDLGGGYVLYHLKIDLHCTNMWLRVEQSPLDTWKILEAEVGEKPDWFIE